MKTKLSKNQLDAIRHNQLSNAIRKINEGKTITAREEQLIAEAAGREKSKPACERVQVMVPNMQVAANNLGLRRETLRMAKEKGCPAFRGNGCVHTGELLEWLAAHPETVSATEDIPDYRTEKALRERANRIADEVNAARVVEEVMPVKPLQPIMVGLAKTLTMRLMAIPERVCQKYAADMDPQSIKDDLRVEITKALKALSELNPKELFDKIMAEEHSTN